MTRVRHLDTAATGVYVDTSTEGSGVAGATAAAITVAPPSPPALVGDAVACCAPACAGTVHAVAYPQTGEADSTVADSQTGSARDVVADRQTTVAAGIPPGDWWPIGARRGPCEVWTALLRLSAGDNECADSLRAPAGDSERDDNR